MNKFKPLAKYCKTTISWSSTQPSSVSTVAQLSLTQSNASCTFTCIYAIVGCSWLVVTLMGRGSAELLHTYDSISALSIVYETNYAVCGWAYLWKQCKFNHMYMMKGNFLDKLWKTGSQLGLNGASDLSWQCSTTWAMATGQPAFTILNITLYVYVPRPTSILVYM